MVLKSKEEFIDLYLAVRAKTGYLTFTQKYPDDFLPWFESGKYQHLFSFFHHKDDFDFLPYLKSKYESSHSIEIINREATLEDTIYIQPNFYYFSNLCHLDTSLCSEMEELIFDMEKTKRLKSRLQSFDTSVLYQVANPNGFYQLQEGEKLFVDGTVENLGNDKYFIENALCAVSESFSFAKLKEIKVSSYYKENDNYVDQIIEKILFYNFCRNNYIKKASSYFKEVQKDKVYQYKMF